MLWAAIWTGIASFWAYMIIFRFRRRQRTSGPGAGECSRCGKTSHYRFDCPANAYPIGESSRLLSMAEVAERVARGEEDLLDAIPGTIMVDEGNDIISYFKGGLQ